MAPPQKKPLPSPNAVRLDYSRASIEVDDGNPLPQEVDSTRRSVDLEFVRFVLDSNENLDKVAVNEIMEGLEP